MAIGTNAELPVIQVDKSTAEDKRIAIFVKDIENCKSIKTLKLLHGMINDSILIKNAYFKKEAELIKNK